MIGGGAPHRRGPGRAGILALCGVVLMGGLLGLRSPDPARADPAAWHLVVQQVVADRADAISALSKLRDTITAALGEGRAGAALTVAGSDAPGPHLEACGRRLAAAEPLLVAARVRLRDLAAWLAVAGPGTPTPVLELVPGELSATGGQLISAAAPADAFAAMRADTDATLSSLRDAFVALDAGDAATALRAADAAAASLRAVQAWPGRIDTLPIWIGTTSALVGAVAAMARAIERGDPSAAAAAETAYRQAAADAHQADIALAIALAEGGSAVSAGALASVAQEQAAVEAALGQLLALRAPPDPV
jgi:hypothetical protein